VGAPVFVLMSGLAVALFFREMGAEGAATVPTAVFGLVSIASLSRDEEGLPCFQKRTCARQGRVVWSHTTVSVCSE